jgi:hypothetical protein
MEFFETPKNTGTVFAWRRSGFQQGEKRVERNKLGGKRQYMEVAIKNGRQGEVGRAKTCLALCFQLVWAVGKRWKFRYEKPEMQRF